MKHLQRFAGILTAFCLMIILFFTSVEAVVYWTPGYFEKEYTKYQVLDDLPSMTMDDLLDVTDQMMAYLKGKRADLHVTTHMGGETREFFNEREIAHMEDVQGLFLKAIALRRICLVVCVVMLLFMILSKADLRTLLPSSLCIGTGLPIRGCRKICAQSRSRRRQLRQRDRCGLSGGLRHVRHGRPQVQPV